MSLPRLRIEGKKWDTVWRVQIGRLSFQWRRVYKSHCWLAISASGDKTFLYGQNKKEVIESLRKIYVEQDWKVKKYGYS